MSFSASATPMIASFRQRTSESFIVVDVENRVPSVFHAMKLTVTQSLLAGCSVPLPGLSTFIARPEGIVCASTEGAATSGGAVTTRPVLVICAVCGAGLCCCAKIVSGRNIVHRSRSFWKGQHFGEISQKVLCRKELLKIVNPNRGLIVGMIY